MLTFPAAAKTAGSEIILHLGSNDALVSWEQVQIDKDSSIIPLFQDSTEKIYATFVLDLADIDNPTLLGKLKISNYSTYHCLINNNHILGFGVDTTDSGVQTRMKMELFDISDI